MNASRRIAVIALPVMLILIGLVWWGLWNPSGVGTPHEGISDSSEAKVVVVGYVEPEGGVVSLNPLLPGRVARVLVAEGDVVAAGAELLGLDEATFRIKLEQAEAGVQAAYARLAQAEEAILIHSSKIAQQKEAVVLAAERLDSAKELGLAWGVIRQAEASLHAERIKLETLEKMDATLDFQLAQANLAIRKAELGEAQYALGERIVRAPCAGSILRVNVKAGDVLGPMPQEPAILFGAGARRVVRFSVEQEFANQIQPGYVAELRDEGLPGLFVWKGKVTQMGDSFLPTRIVPPARLSLSLDETRTLEGYITLDEGQQMMQFGRKVLVTIRPVTDEVRPRGLR